jgi:hypothetical protein
MPDEPFFLAGSFSEWYWPGSPACLEINGFVKPFANIPVKYAGFLPM